MKYILAMLCALALAALLVGIIVAGASTAKSVTLARGRKPQ
jgi:hypothetical protein